VKTERRVWKRIGPRYYAEVENFLKDREQFCINAISRFVSQKKSALQLWALFASGDRDDALGFDLFGLRRADQSAREVTDLLLLNGPVLFPIFSSPNPPVPGILKKLVALPLYAVQGLRGDVAFMEEALSDRLNPVQRFDYELMSLDDCPAVRRSLHRALMAGPLGLRIDRPEPEDEDQLYELQAGYEREEVLPAGSDFHPAACRSSLEQLLRHEEFLCARLGRRIVGKVNSNAASFSRLQMGGVYVTPEFRGLGVATALCAAFAAEQLLPERGLNLFVKKTNPSAKAVYRRLGFQPLSDYRISYYPP
jgi:ribosomal protein S18 acetylase RimI-like enzyme